MPCRYAVAARDHGRGLGRAHAASVGAVVMVAQRVLVRWVLAAGASGLACGPVAGLAGAAGALARTGACRFVDGNYPGSAVFGASGAAAGRRLGRPRPGRRIRRRRVGGSRMVQRIRALVTGAGAKHAAARPGGAAVRFGGLVAARTRPCGRAASAPGRGGESEGRSAGGGGWSRPAGRRLTR
ncbi:hypothetical protein GCM10010495_74120 [Kitasatospora herbaricolor]|nr:hypothetical protein GCM10010495_74120 [Kitasatospora herbaricolor]